MHLLEILTVHILMKPIHIIVQVPLRAATCIRRSSLSSKMLRKEDHAV